MSAPDRLAERALQRGEPEGPAAVVPQNQLHAIGAEAAGAVVQQDRGGQAQLRKVSQSSSRPDWNPRLNQVIRCSDEPWVKPSGETA